MKNILTRLREKFLAPVLRQNKMILNKIGVLSAKLGHTISVASSLKSETSESAVLKAKTDKQIFEMNKIFYEGKRIYSLDGITNVNLHIEGYENKIYFEKINGSGTLFIFIQYGINNCSFKCGKNNRLVTNLAVTYYGGGNITPCEVFVEIGDNNIFNGNFSIIATGQKIRASQ